MGRRGGQAQSRALESMKDRLMFSRKVDLNANVIGVVLWTILALTLVFHTRPARAGVPTDQIRGTVDRVLSILKDPTLQSANKRQERREQLSQVISARFDLPEMAKRSLGGEWRRLAPLQQQQFIELFSEFLRDVYIADIDSYKGEKVIYKGETQEDQFAVVQTIVRSPEGTDYGVDYRMHWVGNEWKVYDVMIENVSIVNNYRSQFARVINKSSYEGLIRALKEKSLSIKK